MVRINLLPVREIKRRARAKRQITLFALAMVSLLALLGIIGFLQVSKEKQLQQELTKIHLEKQRYDKVLKQIKQLEEDKKLIEKKIDIIHRLKKESSLTVHILDEIANRTPTKRMWLTSLTQEGTTLTLQGIALDNRTIANYMENLKKSPYIQEVSLSNSSLTQYAGRNLKSFSLTCTIGVPEETTAVSPPDKQEQGSTAKQKADKALQNFAQSMHVVPGSERGNQLNQQN